MWLWRCKNQNNHQPPPPCPVYDQQNLHGVQWWASAADAGPALFLRCPMTEKMLIMMRRCSCWHLWSEFDRSITTRVRRRSRQLIPTAAQLITDPRQNARCWPDAGLMLGQRRMALAQHQTSIASTSRSWRDTISLSAVKSVYSAKNFPVTIQQTNCIRRGSKYDILSPI